MLIILTEPYTIIISDQNLADNCQCKSNDLLTYVGTTIISL